MKIVRRISLVLVLMITMSAMNDVNAQFWKRKKNKSKADTTTLKKESKYEKLLKNPQKEAKGLMNLYYVKNKLYLEIPFELLEREMLLGSTVSEVSDNNHAIVGSKPYPPLLVQFTKVDSSIQLRRIVKNKIAPESDNNINSALAKNSIGAILEVFKIKAFNKDRTAGVIDITAFLLKDKIKELSPFARVPNGYKRIVPKGILPQRICWMW